MEGSRAKTLAAQLAHGLAYIKDGNLCIAVEAWTVSTDESHRLPYARCIAFESVRSVVRKAINSSSAIESSQGAYDRGEHGAVVRMSHQAVQTASTGNSAIECPIAEDRFVANWTDVPEAVVAVAWLISPNLSVLINLYLRDERMIRSAPVPQAVNDLLVCLNMLSSTRDMNTVSVEPYHVHNVPNISVPVSVYTHRFLSVLAASLGVNRLELWTSISDVNHQIRNSVILALSSKDDPQTSVKASAVQLLSLPQGLGSVGWADAATLASVALPEYAHSATVSLRDARRSFMTVYWARTLPENVRSANQEVLKRACECLSTFLHIQEMPFTPRLTALSEADAWTDPSGRRIIRTRARSRSSPHVGPVNAGYPSIPPLEEAEEINYDVRSSQVKQGIELRRGKWSSEEEEYANYLMECFQSGTLPLAEGTTLRSLLAQQLVCTPMRITKKFNKDSSIGKQVYKRDVTRSFQEWKQKRDAALQKLRKLRYAFVESVKARAQIDLETYVSNAIGSREYCLHVPPSEVKPAVDPAMDREIIAEVERTASWHSEIPSTAFNSSSTAQITSDTSSQHSQHSGFRTSGNNVSGRKYSESRSLLANEHERMQHLQSSAALPTSSNGSQILSTALAGQSSDRPAMFMSEQQLPAGNRHVGQPSGSRHHNMDPVLPVSVARGMASIAHHNTGNGMTNYNKVSWPAPHGSDMLLHHATTNPPGHSQPRIDQFAQAGPLSHALVGPNGPTYNVSNPSWQHGRTNVGLPLGREVDVSRKRQRSIESVNRFDPTMPDKVVQRPMRDQRVRSMSVDTGLLASYQDPLSAAGDDELLGGSGASNSPAFSTSTSVVSSQGLRRTGSGIIDHAFQHLLQGAPRSQVSNASYVVSGPGTSQARSANAMSVPILTMKRGTSNVSDIGSLTSGISPNPSLLGANGDSSALYGSFQTSATTGVQSPYQVSMPLTATLHHGGNATDSFEPRHTDIGQGKRLVLQNVGSEVNLPDFGTRNQSSDLLPDSELGSPNAQDDLTGDVSPIPLGHSDRNSVDQFDVGDSTYPKSRRRAVSLDARRSPTSFWMQYDQNRDWDDSN